MALMQLELPDAVVAGLSEDDIEAMREAAVVKLYERGRISSGKGARLLALTRRAFLETIGHYGVSEFDDTMDVAAEACVG